MKEVDLEIADLKFPLPTSVVRELAREVSRINYYPTGTYLDIKKAFSDYLGKEFKFGPGNIVFGNGLDEVIDLITRVWGKVNLIPTPTFSQYAAAAMRSDNKMVKINMMKAGKYEVDYDRSLLRKASLVWICNPNNPTGDLVPREKIVDIIDNSPGMVVVDECYFEYTGKTVLDLVAKRKNLIVLRSFSKNFGIAGARLGAAISQPENISRIEMIRQPFNVNRMAEQGGLIALKHKKEYQKIWAEVLRIGRKFAKDVESIGYRTHEVNANYVLVDFSTEAKAKQMFQRLVDNKIKACAGWSEEFDGGLDSYIRFAVAPEADMNRAIEVLSR